MDIRHMLIPRELPANPVEPAAGSVVMLEGGSGTAYQRLFSDGLWHATTTSTGQPWSALVEKTRRPGASPIVLIHEVDTEGWVRTRPLPLAELAASLTSVVDGDQAEQLGPLAGRSGLTGALRPSTPNNNVARNGVDRCVCGCKYWEDDHCTDCGESIADVIAESSSD